MKKLLIYSLLLLAVPYSIFILKGGFNKRPEIKIDPNWSIKELGNNNDINPGEIMRQFEYYFGIKQDLYGSTVLSELNLSEKQLFESVSRIKNKNLPWIFIIKIAIWSLGFGLIMQYLLVIKNKNRIQRIRTVIMLVVFMVFGFLSGSLPNPMESIVQIGKYLAGIGTPHQYALGIFVIFAGFSIVGAKFFCSWACPLGALQESIFNIPVLKNKRFKIPFLLSIIIRGGMFVAFLLGLFVFKDFFHDRSFFQNVNYFNIFNPANLSRAAIYTLPVLFVLSFFIFRPFCHLICPFGFFSWFLEKLAINRVVVDKNKCIDCKLCVKVCPTDAMRGILDGKNRLLQADCWSCGKCIAVCPVDAVIFK
ncbi:MAG TPA: hypothetical protein DCX95_00125 [Elusimicrobia bacterium]|nr:hypothetical protein [Elusimicrobiota bacterium]